MYDSKVYGYVYGHERNFNDSFADAIMVASIDAINLKRRCIPCSDDEDFIVCPPIAGNATNQVRLAGVPVIQTGFAGYGVLENVTVRNGSLQHFFGCPFKDTCLETKLQTFAPNCADGHFGLLCGVCADGWALTSRGCIFCDNAKNLNMLVIIAGCVAAVALLWFKCANLDDTAMMHLALWTGIIQRTWPRVNQSLKILVSNVQIISRIPLMVDVDLPDPFAGIIQGIADIVDGAVDLIPAVACAFGGTFKRRLIARLCIPMGILFIIFLRHRYQVWKLVHTRMPIKPHMKKTWRLKIARALVRSELIHQSTGWSFAMVYLLFPSTAAIIMQSFYCRKIGENVRVLIADYTIFCTGPDGELTDEYMPLLAFGLFATLVWSIGVPTFFGFKLYRNRMTILAGNMNYAGIAYLRPLFQFFKPNCYMFEVFFMLEKFFMTGILVIVRTYLGGFFLANCLGIMAAILMLCAICKYRPSKTDPYNTGNIFSHAILIFTLCSMVALKYPQLETPWLTPLAVAGALLFLQLPFWAYLIRVSGKNLRNTYKQARIDSLNSIKRNQMMEAKSAAKEGTLTLTVTGVQGLDETATATAGAAATPGALYFVVFRCDELQYTKSTSEASSKEGEISDMMALAFWKLDPLSPVKESTEITVQLHRREEVAADVVDGDPLMVEYLVGQATLKVGSLLSGSAKAVDKVVWREPLEGHWHSLWKPGRRFLGTRQAEAIRVHAEFVFNPRPPQTFQIGGENPADKLYKMLARGDKIVGLHDTSVAAEKAEAVKQSAPSPRRRMWKGAKSVGVFKRPDEPTVYRVVKAALIGVGAAVDSRPVGAGKDDPLSMLSPGEKIHVLEIANLSNGQIRLRFERGWVSLLSTRGDKLVEFLSGTSIVDPERPPPNTFVRGTETVSSPSIYRAVKPARIRVGPETDSRPVGSGKDDPQSVLSPGEELTVLEVSKHGGKTRIRFTKGWVSLVSNSGDELFELVSGAAAVYNSDFNGSVAVLPSSAVVDRVRLDPQPPSSSRDVPSAPRVPTSVLTSPSSLPTRPVARSRRDLRGTSATSNRLAQRIAVRQEAGISGETNRSKREESDRKEDIVRKPRRLTPEGPK
jgi:hypothetical protein